MSKNKTIEILSLDSLEVVAIYGNIEPEMALFAYTQGLKGYHNTWNYKKDIKKAKFTKGKVSIALDDYAVYIGK